MNRNFVKIEELNKKIEIEADQYIIQYYRLMNEKNNLILNAKELEKNICMKKAKLHDYQILAKKREIDEKNLMVEVEKLSIQISLYNLIKQKLYYDKLLRLFILNTFSIKSNIET